MADPGHVPQLEILRPPLEVVQELASLGVAVQAYGNLRVVEETPTQRVQCQAAARVAEFLATEQGAATQQMVGSEDRIRTVADPFEQPAAIAHQ